MSRKINHLFPIINACAVILRIKLRFFIVFYLMCVFVLLVLYFVTVYREVYRDDFLFPSLFCVYLFSANRFKSVSVVINIYKSVG